MRLPSRKFLIGFCGVGLVGGGAIAYAKMRGAGTTGAKGSTKVAELSASEFNALQDAGKRRLALQGNHLPWNYHARRQKEASLDPLNPDSPAAGPTDMKLLFYRLLGCPYCAKVESVLRFHDVPYEEVLIDPINGRGLPDPRYSLAPQLYLAPLQSSKAAATSSTEAAAPAHADGVYLVDSPFIVSELATPLGYGRDLQDARIAATRDWITNRFQGISFTAINSTVRNAYAAYTGITPAQYQNPFYRIIGSFALYGLANYKIRPRLLAQSHPLEEAYCKAHSTPAEHAEATPAKQTPEAWLREALAVFLDRRAPHATFHGGAQPDLADVEMYGVTRVVSNHPKLSGAVKAGDFGEWEKAMEEVIRERRGGRP